MHHKVRCHQLLYELVQGLMIEQEEVLHIPLQAEGQRRLFVPFRSD